MKFNYKFSNLLGTVYRKGNVLFTPDGNCLLSPVGNRVTVFDLVKNQSYTMPFENKKNIVRMALSPDARLLLTIDEDGKALLASFPKRVVLHHFNFKESVEHVCFSPNGKYLAVTYGNYLQIWQSPGTHKEFCPFVKHRQYAGHTDIILHISWTPDSRFIVTSSRDMTTRIYSLFPIDNYAPITLVGHKESVLASIVVPSHPHPSPASSSPLTPLSSSTMLTVSRDGAIFQWIPSDSATPNHPMQAPVDEQDQEEDPQQQLSQRSSSRSTPPLRFRPIQRYYLNPSLNQNATVASAHFQSRTDGHTLLVVGFHNGLFALYMIERSPPHSSHSTEHSPLTIHLLHALSASQHAIDTVCLNASGDWLALASQTLGQLLVWEWPSESYILKQQGYHDVHRLTALAYSPNDGGQYLVTGGEDGSLKVWNTWSGYCIVTFREHAAAISDVCFSPHGHVAFSSSLDGTVRAYDLLRYRCFRVFTGMAGHSLQFSCLATDGDLVVAGSQDVYDIYVWRIQTGQLLDVLAGHEGPVSQLLLDPVSQHLISGSWDHSVRVWDVFDGERLKTAKRVSLETWTHTSEVVCLALRPDGRELCVSTLDGQLSFYDTVRGEITTTLEGRRDLMATRKEADATTSENVQKYVSSMAYSADGEYLLCGGGGRSSAYVCLYRQGVLMKRFPISRNHSLDGIQEKLNSHEGAKRQRTAATRRLYPGRVDRMDEGLIEQGKSLPGVRSGEAVDERRRGKPAMRILSVKFSPTNQSFAAATTEGAVIYSTQDSVFDPYELGVDVTPRKILSLLGQKATKELEEEEEDSDSNSDSDEEVNYVKALVYALRLNEPVWIQRVYESIPLEHVLLTCQTFPVSYVIRLLTYIAGALEKTPHLDYHLQWCSALLKAHGSTLKTMSSAMSGTQSMTCLRTLHKAVHQHYESLSTVANDTVYLIKYLLDREQPSDEILVNGTAMH